MSNRKSHDSAKMPTLADASVNGEAAAKPELEQETEADAEVAEDMKKASIDNKSGK